MTSRHLRQSTAQASRARRAIVRLAAISLAAIFLAAACGGRPPAPDRPQPIAYADTLPISEPVEREVVEVQRLIGIAASGEVGNAIGLRALAGERREALNVDHFDDVVNSAWFEQRNGRKHMSPDAVRTGNTSTRGPADGPLTIVAAKVEGISPGYTVRDSRGDRYVLKFDPKGYLYLSSGAGVISNRLFYAAGYHVPEDYIFHFQPDRLRVDPEATVTGDDLVERPLTLQVARDALGRTDSLPDGGYVAVASKFVPGIPKGPFFFEGRRDDDPNDHYQHEHRRELRGLKVVSAWLNHVDMRFMNTLDVYVEPGYLRHYLIDFAATLGSGTIRPHEPREGLEYNFDLWDVVGRLFTLGFHRAGWEDAEWSTIHPTVGWLPGEAFHPETWKPNWPNQAFNNLTTRDGYWGAKLVGSFTDAQIRAAVAAGELPDEWAADTLATILMTRRDAVVEHWYGKVSPVENPRVVDDDGLLAVAFEDLGVRDGPWSPAGSRYEWRFEDPAAGIRREGSSPVGRRGDQALVIVENVPGRARDPDAADRYATLDIRIVREGSGVEPKPARVYLRWSGDRYEVAGLEH